MSRFVATGALRRISLCLLAACFAGSLFAAEAEVGTLAGLAKTLSSDEFQGRGIGTEGLEKAAEVIADRFEELGLKTDLIDGKPFQPFTVTIGSELGKSNELRLVGPATEKKPRGQQIDLKLGRDYQPLAIGGSGEMRAPLVFVGYGITGKQEEYDDYAQVDVEGRIVVVLRHEPQQDNPHSVFNGTDHSRHAPFVAKVSNAFQHGATAVIFVTDQAEIDRRRQAQRDRWETAIAELVKLRGEWNKIEEPTDKQFEEHRRKVDPLAKQIQRFGENYAKVPDEVLGFRRAGQDLSRDMPVVHIRREVIDNVVQSVAGKDLATIEQQIDQGPTPQSFELTGWRTVGRTDVQREVSQAKNVIAVLEGDGPRAEETIVIGAHYDHLGFGGPGSRAPGKKEIHNGADDNASGTAVLLKVAEQLSSGKEKLPRRVVFIAFSGEERGLLGSAHYAQEPVVPLEKTVAMLNMDMVGRLQENKLIVDGVDTAEEFGDWVEEVNEPLEFDLVKKPGGFGPSDHATFYARKIPVIHFFTGSHEDYHLPSDDFDKLDLQGMQRIGRFVASMTVQIAEAPDPPTYQESAHKVASRGGTRPYLGSIPDFRAKGKGYALSGVAKDGPAERAGMQGGDVIIQFGDSKIGNLQDIDSALRKYKAGDKVPVTVLRDGKQKVLEVTLDPPK